MIQGGIAQRKKKKSVKMYIIKIKILNFYLSWLPAKMMIMPFQTNESH